MAYNESTNTYTELVPYCYDEDGNLVANWTTHDLKVSWIFLNPINFVVICNLNYAALCVDVANKDIWNT